MAPTTSFADCQKLAAAVQSLGGAVPDQLGHLLQAYDLLSSPVAAQRPDDAILTAALDGSLTAEKLAKLAPAAATAAMTTAYLRDLARDSEHVLLGAWHRAMKAGAADAVLDSLRPNFDKHARAIEHARMLINPESSAEQILAVGEPALVKAWQELDGHLRVIQKIAAIAAQFGCRPAAQFSQIVEYPLAENARIDDRALATTNGELVRDSSLFGRPDQGHRTSPFFRVGGLRLHSIEEMRERYNEFAAKEFDQIHSGPRGGRLIDGVIVEDPAPRNPYRQEKVS
jgi:hypothetical protein